MTSQDHKIENVENIGPLVEWKKPFGIKSPLIVMSTEVENKVIKYHIHSNDFMQSTTAFIKINIIGLIQILLHKYPMWWHNHCFLNADDSTTGSGQTNISPTNRNRQKSQRQTKLFNLVQYLTKSST